MTISTTEVGLVFTTFSCTSGENNNKGATYQEANVLIVCVNHILITIPGEECD